jgi:diaminohydroxyphosphoribosylaminopyrimidine deaminase/5-amino-6-(5-phosphoribosylamino)uracil reductase
MVGALIVEGGEIVAEGWHHAAGQPHAEIEALRALGRQPAEDAILYVTLEPCSTCGRTGACTDAIIGSGIRRVVVGAVDPNPAHAGQGLSILRAAGIEVIVGVLADDCSDLNLIFNHWIVKQSPFFAAKMALTLDGKFAAASGHSKWVTGEIARADVMRWRRYFPAIAVGANTVLCDDPSLTSRIDGEVWCPRRFVFDRQLRTAELETLPQLYTDAHKARTVVLCSSAARSSLRQKLIEQGIELWELPTAADGHLDWQDLRSRFSQAGIIGLYIETGPSLATTLIENRRVDYVYLYQAPKFIGDSGATGIGSPRETRSMSEAIELTEVRHAVLGDDVLVRGKI